MVKAPGIDDLLISCALVCASIAISTARTYISQMKCGK